MALTGMQPFLKIGISPKVVNERMAIVCKKHCSMKNHLILSMSILLICCLDPKHLNTGKGKMIKKISSRTIMPSSTYKIVVSTFKKMSVNFKNQKSSKYSTKRITKNWKKKAATFSLVQTKRSLFSSSVTSFLRRNSSFGTFVNRRSILLSNLVF